MFRYSPCFYFSASMLRLDALALGSRSLDFASRCPVASAVADPVSLVLVAGPSMFHDLQSCGAAGVAPVAAEDAADAKIRTAGHQRFLPTSLSSARSSTRADYNFPVDLEQGGRFASHEAMSIYRVLCGLSSSRLQSIVCIALSLSSLSFPCPFVALLCPFFPLGASCAPSSRDGGMRPSSPSPLKAPSPRRCRPRGPTVLSEWSGPGNT